MFVEILELVLDKNLYSIVNVCGQYHVEFVWG
jgi:hypothetical protein